MITIEKKSLAGYSFIDLFAGIGGMRLAFEEAGGHCVCLSSLEKQQVFVRPGFIERIVHIPFPGHPVKQLGIAGQLNAGCRCAVGHELFHALPAVGPLGFLMPFGDLAARRPEHIGQPPGCQLAGPDRNRYGAPGNFFINQLHRLLPWDNLSRSAITDPHGLFSAFDGSPPKKNRL